MKYLFCVLFVFISCNIISQKENKISNQDISKLSRVQLGIPSPYNYLIIFVKSKDSKILKTNIDQLREIYADKYSLKYNDFSTFLSFILNKGIVLEVKKSHNWFGSFKVNNELFNKYKDSTGSLKKLFLKEIKEGEYILEQKELNKLTKSEVNTVLYLFYQKGYFISYNDYIGVYNLTDKLVDSTK